MSLPPSSIAPSLSRPPVPEDPGATAAVAADGVWRVDPAQWDVLLQRFPARTVFHGMPWLRAISRRHGLEPVLFAVGEREAPTAIWPWLRRRVGPLIVAGSPLPGWGTAYMGPLLVAELADRPEAADGAIASILREPELRRASYLEARVLTRGQTVPMGGAGFERLRTFSTYLLDLRPTEDELWANLDRKCRNAVRRGERQGYRVAREEGRAWIEPFLGMAEQVFAAWGQAPPYDAALLEAIADELGSAGQLWVYSSWLEGDGAPRRDATSLFFVDGRTVYYWAAASFDEAKKRAPNNVLVWEVIKAARAQGYETLDFISSSGTAGRFKKTFGPEEHPICEHLGRSRTRFEALLKRSYERFARWRRAAK